jgi:hypothetical protein
MPEHFTLRKAEREAYLKKFFGKPFRPLPRIAHQDFSPDRSINVAQSLLLVRTVTRISPVCNVAKKVESLCFVATLITRENVRVS